MFKKLVCILTVMACSLALNAADTPFDQLLKASKKLVVNPSDSESMDIVKSKIDLFNESSVKASIIKVIGLATLASDKSSFDDFEIEMKAKYPWMDFSFADADSSAYGDELKKTVNFLALNASSALEAQNGNAPSKLLVRPRTEAVEAFSGGDSKMDKEPAPTEETVEIAKKDDEPVVQDTAEIKEQMKEAAKTKSGDIDKDSIYYKVYHAAVKAQKGEGDGIRELVQLTFEEKPEELTSAIVKTMTLGMLSANSKSTNPYIIKVNSVYLDNAFLNFLDEEPFSVSCNFCAGKGQREAKCRKCLDGKCRNCKGSGEISYKGLGGEFVRKQCPTCEGQKNCSTCAGERVSKKPCTTCGTRGTRFNKNAFKPEYVKSMQYLVDLTPKLAEEANVYIGVGVNKLAIARIEAIREDQKRKEAEEKARMKVEREKELARLEEERKKKMTKEVIQDGQRVIISEFEVPAGGSNENLEYALFEFENYLKAQQKRTKSIIYDKVDARFVDGKAMLYIEVSDSFNQNGREYKEQILDGFYRFWKLRSGANGSGSNVDVVMNYQGKQIAGTKNGEVFVN